MAIEVVREQILSRNIVIVDGLSKSGKSLVLPVISSLSNGELPQFDHIFEYLATFHWLGKMDRQAAESLMKLYADLDLYNVMIGRNTNFRKADDSGAFKNLLEDRQRARLAAPEGDIVVRQIRRRNPVLILMVHYIFQANDIFFSAFGNRLKLYIMLLRHPAFLVEAWNVRRWSERFNRNPRDFQICVAAKGRKVPWFAAEVPVYYPRLGTLEQSIYVVHLFIKNIERHYHRLPEPIQRRILFVPFEPFAADPIAYLRQIAKKTNSQMTAFTRRVLHQLNLPRPLDRGQIKDKRNQMSTLLKKEKVSKRLQSAFHSLCDAYEKKYLAQDSLALPRSR